MKRYLQRFSRQRDFPLTAGRRQSLDAATTHLSSFYKLCQKTWYPQEFNTAYKRENISHQNGK